MSDYITQHMDLVYFIYGQMFFTAGLAILLKQRGLSHFRLARYMWLLAIFFLIHGISEWGHLFIPSKEPILGESWAGALYRVEVIGWAVSFAFLLQFAVLILAPRLLRNQNLRNSAGWYAIGWSAAVITGSLFLPLDTAEVWIRYLLGFPAAALAALAFFRERSSFKTFPSPRAWRSLTVAGICFAAYAFMAGLIVPSGNLIPGLKYDNVVSVTGLPIQLFRMAAALVITIVMVRMLSVFDIEIQQRISESERHEAIISDRRRIARDLHDGTIQSIYAVGLQLEAASSELEASSEEAGNAIRGVIDSLNEIISNIRSYIFELDFSKKSNILGQQVREMVAELSANDVVDARFEMIGAGRELPLEIQSNIVLIMNECLSNIRRHSLAGNASITLEFCEDNIKLDIEDDGVGIPPSILNEAIGSGHGGLNNISERVCNLNGLLEITERPGGGTGICISIPYASVRWVSESEKPEKPVIYG